METVCKGERARERDSASPPCRRKSRWGWGRGEGLNTELWGRIKRKSRSREQCQVLKAGRQAATWLLCVAIPYCPQAYDNASQAGTPGLISQREICQVEEQSPMPFPATGESSSEILSCPPSMTGENHSWALKWDVVFVYLTPSCHKTSFPTSQVIEVLVIQKCNSNMGLGSARYRFPLKKKKSHPHI